MINVLVRLPPDMAALRTKPAIMAVGP